MNHAGARHRSVWAAAPQDRAGMRSSHVPCPLCPCFLENLTQLPQHFLPPVGGVMFAHLGTCLILAHLVDPIPEQLRPPPDVLGEPKEVLVEKAKGRDGLAMA